MTSQDPNQQDEGPWYKQPWCWFVLAPLIAVMLAWIPFMTIAVKDADDVVIDNYYKEGRMINQRFDQDQRAQQLGLTGELLIDLEVGEVILKLGSRQPDVVLPETIALHLDHPVEADNDLTLELKHSYAGQYRADLEQRINHRWYLRLEPVSDAESKADSEERAMSDWRLTGEIDLARGQRLVFGDAE
ncbi:FixH family protein [Pseudomaricurvus alkylphenolicus]|jgi:hypothetical protein|uniref:FixH family protein n=1 Tax=Pseudomaricurvus alkylphenolicus TaxID=1306991 RepID=UPI00141F8062|nr:FixH family protein [Pseudomaricurvus alkylphenolicus]NIB41950.1 FixH family protein [Pseudomaricurvus alkylphenolicus]